MMPAILKSFVFMGDDLLELASEKESSKSKIRSCDEKCSEESKESLLKQFCVDK